MPGVEAVAPPPSPAKDGAGGKAGQKVYTHRLEALKLYLLMPINAELVTFFLSFLFVYIETFLKSEMRWEIMLNSYIIQKTYSLGRTLTSSSAQVKNYDCQNH